MSKNKTVTSGNDMTIKKKKPDLVLDSGQILKQRKHTSLQHGKARQPV